MGVSHSNFVPTTPAHQVPWPDGTYLDGQRRWTNWEAAVAGAPGARRRSLQKRWPPTWSRSCAARGRGSRCSPSQSRTSASGHPRRHCRTTTRSPVARSPMSGQIGSKSPPWLPPLARDFRRGYCYPGARALEFGKFSGTTDSPKTSGSSQSCAPCPEAPEGVCTAVTRPAPRARGTPTRPDPSDRPTSEPPDTRACN